MLETMWSEGVAAVYKDEVANTGLGRVYSAEGTVVKSGRTKPTTQGTGCALFISSAIPQAKSEGVVWKRADGKAMAVNVTWHGRDLLVLLTHSPHTDDERTKFYEDVKSDLEAALGGELGKREGVWMADHNCVANPHKDCLPAGHPNVNHDAGTTSARHALAEAINARVDTFRILHPTSAGCTHEAKTHKSRLDAINVASTMMRGATRIVEAEHVPAKRYAVAYHQNGNDILKESDHSLVRLTYRVSDTPRGERGFTFASEILHSPLGERAVREAVRAHACSEIAHAHLDIQVEDDGQATLRISVGDVEDRHERLVQRWKDTSEVLRRAEKHALYAKVATAHKKWVSMKRHKAHATTPNEKKAAAAQTERARQQYSRALQAIQAHSAKRRGNTATDESWETTKTVHAKTEPRRAAAPIAALRRTRGERAGEIETSTQGIHEAMAEYWEPIFQMLTDPDAAAAAEQGIMQRIKAAAGARLTADELDGLRMEAILATPNLREAVKRVKEHTTPGQDGVPSEVYRTCSDEPDLISHLRNLYHHIMMKGEMTENMRQSVTTLVYKDKGDTDDPARYRPICVTAVEYRILATAMAQRLAEVMHRLVGDSQIGFQVKRIISENIDLMEETLRYCNEDAPHKGGAIAILDNAHAYDYVAWPFLHKCLEAFGLPECFRSMVQTMYKNVSTRFKINDTLGPAIQKTSGVIQGCPLSSLLFLLVMEVLLTMIREDPAITGIEIPGPTGSDAPGETETVTERSLADDLAVYVSNPSKAVPALRGVLARFSAMSGQRINLGKSAVVLLGKDRFDTTDDGTETDPATWWPGMRFTVLELCVEKYHGILLTTKEGAKEQYEKKAREMRERIADDAKAFVPRSVEGRQHLARGRYAGRLMHTFTHQVPEQSALDAVMKVVQLDLDKATLGKHNWITKELARQRKEDGGLGHVQLQPHMEAVWAHTMRRCLEPDHRPWKNFVCYYLRRAYGAELSQGKQLLTSNMSFATITELPSCDITEKSRQAFKAFGALPKLQVQQRRTRGGSEEEQKAQEAQRQQATTPAQEHAVLYYLAKPGAQLQHGVSVGAPPPAVRTTLSGQLLAHKKGNHNRYSLMLSSSSRVCFSDATQTEATEYGNILAVRAALIRGTQHDVSDKGARRRAGLTEGRPEDRHAAEGKRIVYIGEGSADAHIPPEAILAEMPIASLTRCLRTRKSKADHMKAIPQQTLDALREFERDAERQCKERECESAETRTEQEGITRIQRAWRRAELERQLLFHNPHYRPSSEMSTRGTCYTEGLAITWAEAGVSRLRHVLTRDKRRVLTPDEFAAKHPDLPDARPIYERLVRAMPHEWHAALTRGGDACDGEHTWWRTRNGTYLEAWTSKEKEDAGRKHIRAHVREEGTSRLREAPEVRVPASIPARAVECSVRPVHRNEKAKALSAGGTTRDMRRARDEDLANEVLCDDCEHAPLRLDEIAMQPPSGLTRRHPVTMQRLQVRHAREMRTADRIVIPRAWDHGEEKGWRHYARLYAHLSRGEYAAKMREVFCALRHEAVPPYMQDVLYKTAMSGHRMGPRKFTAKDQADRGLCHRCGAKRSAGWMGPEETVEHGFHDCLEVARLWRMVIEDWNESVQEQLDPSDARVTLLGDRGDKRRAVTEEAWRVVHACVQWVIHTTRCASHTEKGGSKTHLQAPAMMRAVRKKLQELVSARWRAALRTRDTSAFRENWLDTGACLRRKDGGVRACALSRIAGDAGQQPTDPNREPALLSFTDGAWNPDVGLFEAGAGVAEFEVVAEEGNASEDENSQAPPQEELFDMRQLGTYPPNDPPRVRGRLTHVHGCSVMDEGQARARGRRYAQGYIGATKQSNNTAELTAIHYALQRAAERPRDAPPEDIHTDSLYARNVTLGVWRGKRRVHREMIRNLRRMWMRVQAKRGRGTVRILHVRSHIGVPGNELADKTAEAAMRNADQVKNARVPVLVTIDLEWARAQMRAITGSNRLRPPTTNNPSTPTSASYTHPRAGDG